MSETARSSVDLVDHREQADWVALSSFSGTNRRLHRVDGDPGPDDLEQGAEVDPACNTSLTDEDSYWRAKPAAVYPPGYHDLCEDENCFGAPE